jgi:hypothetical protein
MSSALWCVSERARVGAARLDVQHRRLDLDEALVGEGAPEARHDGVAHLEVAARLVVDDQVGVALAEPGVGVGEAVPLVGQRAHRLREQLDASAFTDSSPVRVAITVPWRPPSRRGRAPSRRRTPSSPTTALEMNSWISPSRSRIVANTSLPVSRFSMIRPATVTWRRSRCPGRSSPLGPDLGERVAAVEPVRVRLVAARPELVDPGERGSLLRGEPAPGVYLALPQSAAAGLTGTDVSSILATDTVVMNEITARQTGAQVGDVVDMRVLDGPVRSYRIAAVKPHTQLGGSEIVLNTAAVERLGVVDDTRIAVWGIDSRADADAAIAALGIENRRDTQVSRSWSPPSPDDTISTARLKEALGEPWYQVTGESTIAMHPDVDRREPHRRSRPAEPTIPVRARCHRRIVADLQAALAEVAAAGLAGAIDVANTNTYGGCFNPRYSRLGGFLSATPTRPRST